MIRRLIPAAYQLADLFEAMHPRISALCWAIGYTFDRRAYVAQQYDAQPPHRYT